MTILLIYDKIRTGGMETLMGRIATGLASMHHKVYVLVGGIEADPRQLGIVSDVVELGSTYSELPYQPPESGSKILNPCLRKVRPDSIIAFSPSALLFAIAYLSCLKGENDPGVEVRLVAGVWNPAYYKTTFLKSILMDPAAFLFKWCLPDESRLYMSNRIRDDIERRWISDSRGVVWPLPVDLNKYKKIQANSDSNIILSIGRLDDMKTYNLIMPQVVRQLIDEGIKCEWHVYGEGAMMSEILKIVDELDVSSFVKLHGSISYDKLPEVFSSAKVFIGMGTSLIEASAAGIPSILAMPYAKSTLTYGYFYQLEKYNCGDLESSAPNLEYTELLRSLFLSDRRQQQKLGERCRQHAAQFSSDTLMSELESILKKAGRCPEINRLDMWLIFADWVKKINRIFRNKAKI